MTDKTTDPWPAEREVMERLRPDLPWQMMSDELAMGFSELRALARRELQERGNA